jgi:hypothetical protein
MTFDEIFKQYASQGFTKPVMAQGIETIQPIMPLVKPILPMGQQDSGDNNGPTMPTYDPNVGKNFYDYEADAYGVGPTLQGGIAQLIDLYQQLPTPLNLAMKGANAFGNFIDQFSGNSQGINAVTKPGTYSYDDSGTGGSGTGGASESTFSSQGFGSEGNTVSTDFGSFDLSRD